MRLTTFEERRAAAVIRRMTELLEENSYQNAAYQNSDCHAHYFTYESVEEDGEVAIWDLQVELEGEHEINHKPAGSEDWEFVGETFQELMNCFEIYLDIAI